MVWKILELTQLSVFYEYLFIKCALRWSEKSVRFENLMGIGFQIGQILWDLKILWELAFIMAKFCEIWKSYGNWLSEWPNSVRFYLAVCGIACMDLVLIVSIPSDDSD